jgi:hypothetical protein
MVSQEAEAAKAFISGRSGGRSAAFEQQCEGMRAAGCA